MPRTALQWPALELGDRDLPRQLRYERGLWGKVHGAPTDFRWIATTPAFAAVHQHLETELPLGPEDAPATATLWRVLGDTCYAVAIYPSRAVDASNRTGFVEKQIVEWKRPPELPAAIGALLLLPYAASLPPADWSQPRSDVRWSDDEHEVELEAPPLPLSADALDQAIDDAVRALAGATTEAALTELYASLLAGNRAVRLEGVDKPLSAAAVAALLLPLPRATADAISIAGWLPSERVPDEAVDSIRRCWQIVLGGTAAVPRESATPTGEELRQAEAMAKTIFAQRAAPRRSSGAVKPIQLALWGPTAAGKTALLAKLFLDADDENWDVFPTQRSLQFIRDMRDRMRTTNLFPKATAVGHLEGIEYVFRHRKNGVTASLQLEDRAGKESEFLNDAAEGKVSLKERLGTAAGIVLLFDPVRNEAELEAFVANTLDLLYVASKRAAEKDPRPIAVCVSKADRLIETPGDFRHAVADPDAFVRDRVSPALLRALDRYCTNYRLFPVSAAGVRLRHGVVEPAVFIDDTFEPRICPGGMPFNVMAPFSWLLDQLTRFA